MLTTRFTFPFLFALTLLAASASPTSAAEEPSGQEHATIAGSPSESTTELSDASAPPAAWNDLGCVGCHGDDGAYTDEIKGAIGKPVDQVARWIRNAPSIKPGTDMPSFEGLIDEPDSKALARWVLERAANLE